LYNITVAYSRPSDIAIDVIELTKTLFIFLLNLMPPSDSVVQILVMS